MTEREKVFTELGEDEIEGPTEVESMCMQCGNNGITKLLLIHIPFFREIVVSAFSCGHCHWSNNQIQEASEIQRQGCKTTLKITSRNDMDRSVIKTTHSLFRIDEIEFEIPSNTQQGEFTTLEDIFSRAIEGLGHYQPVRKYNQPQLYESIEKIIESLTKIRDGEMPATIILDDPTGNSFIQNPFAPKKDPNMRLIYYNRTPEQDEKLGLGKELPQVTSDVPLVLQQGSPMEELEKSGEEEGEDFANTEVICIPSECPSCGTPGMIKMQPIEIPHFKEVVIMAFTCEACGVKSNEVKAGGPIPPLGRRYILKVETVDDLCRDVLKSETGTILLPDIELEVISASLGSQFTTVEGLLTQVRDDLKKCLFCTGDSSTREDIEKSEKFFIEFGQLLSLERSFVMILDDPLGNCYVQNICAPDPDPCLEIVEYERTQEQNDELGLSDMKTENYTECDDDGQKSDNVCVIDRCK